MSWLDKYKKEKFKKVEPQNVEVQPVPSDPTSFYPSPSRMDIPALPELPKEEVKPQPLKISKDMLTDIATGVMQGIQDRQVQSTKPVPAVQDNNFKFKLQSKLEDIRIENIVNQKLEAALRSLL